MMKEVDLTVALLVGGDSKRFTTEKALALFRGRPLIHHMLSIAKQLSPRVLVVASNDDQIENLQKYIGDVLTAVDPKGGPRCALNGAVTAFEYANTRYTLLLPVDTPLASVPLLKTLYELAGRHGAVVPAWPSGYVEPLHAVYLTEHAYAKGLDVLADGGCKMQELLNRLSNVLYVSTLVLKQFDGELKTFANINTERDLRKLERTAARGS
ncbi:MAG: molybdenum cofactor guanylyltransferase [Candidatus Thorarchaeota archaeon]